MPLRRVNGAPATAMVIDSDAVAKKGIGAESVTCALKFAVTADVGVPLMTPELALKVRPAGKDPLAMLSERVPVPPLPCRVAV